MDAYKIKYISNIVFIYKISASNENFCFDILIIYLIYNKKSFVINKNSFITFNKKKKKKVLWINRSMKISTISIHPNRAFVLSSPRSKPNTRTCRRQRIVGRKYSLFARLDCTHKGQRAHSYVIHDAAAAAASETGKWEAVYGRRSEWKTGLPLLLRVTAPSQSPSALCSVLYSRCAQENEPSTGDAVGWLFQKVLGFWGYARYLGGKRQNFVLRFRWKISLLNTLHRCIFSSWKLSI